MIKELDTVVLTRDFPEHRLKAGDTGVVVLRYPDAAAFEVEFMNPVGRTIAVLTLEKPDVRAAEPGDPGLAQKTRPTPEDLLEDELRALEDELDRVGEGQDPASAARRAPLLSRRAVIKWLKGHTPLTPDEFETTLRKLAGGELRVVIPKDRLGTAQRQGSELLERWRVLTAR